MTEWFVSSAVLAAVLIALRYVLQGKLSPKLQYGLWALLLIRLLVPVSVGQSAVSVENFVPAAEHRVLYLAQRTAQPASQAEAAEPAAEPAVLTEQQSEQSPDAAPVTANLKGLPRTVWLCGAAGVFCWFLGCELVCRRRLRRGARRVSAAQKGCPAVFVSPAAGSPCLFGLLRPAIYLTPETDADETARRHCLVHERTHYRHGDHIWSALRCVCLALHWFDPLVWWAAALSRTDAELACDEDAVRVLGEEERTAYGRTLLQMTCRTHVSLLSAATSMSGRGSQLRARIRAIAKPVKTALPALLAAVLITGFGLLLSGTARAETAPQQADMQSAAAVEEPEQTVSEAPVEHIEPKLLALEETAPEPEEAQPEAEPAPDDAAGSAVPDDLELLDTFLATAYCQTGTTATGTYTTVGRTLAVNPGVIPYGTHVWLYLEDGTLVGDYYAEDTGGNMLEHPYVIDIYMGTDYDTCIEWGVKRVSVYVEKDAGS